MASTVSPWHHPPLSLTKCCKAPPEKLDTLINADSKLLCLLICPICGKRSEEIHSYSVLDTHCEVLDNLSRSYELRALVAANTVTEAFLRDLFIDDRIVM